MLESKKLISLRKAPDEPSIIYHWEIPETLGYFDGHFPDRPILPAVAWIDACLELARLEKAAEGAPFMRSIRSAKFTGAIVPGDRVKIVASQDSDKWKFVWSKDSAQIAEIDLLL